MRVVCSPESKHSGSNCFVQQRPKVYIPCMSPRNHADCVGNDCPWDETDPLFYKMHDDATNF